METLRTDYQDRPTAMLICTLILISYRIIIIILISDCLYKFIYTWKIVTNLLSTFCCRFHRFAWKKDWVVANFSRLGG